VKLGGPVADAFVVVIRPTDPSRLPAFTAELFATNGKSALAYLDLPSPGLSRDLVNEVADQTTVLSIRHAPFLPRDETPPTCVMDDSPGGFLFTQAAGRDAPARLSQAFEDYLNVWIDFAFPFADENRLRLSGHQPWKERKHQSVLLGPMRSVFAQHLGSDGAHRFVAEFLFP
jgi:hypothetical protein